MAQFDHRIDLKKAQFPMLTSELGRTVLLSNNRNTPTNEEPNVPEVLYCHNVMPTDRGMQSVGFKPIMTAPGSGGASVLFKKVLHIENVENSTAAGIWYNDRPAMLAYTTEPLNNLYVNLYGATTWILEPTVSGSNLIEPSVSNVKGASYVLIRPNVVVAADNLGSLNIKAFIGSPFSAIEGITESNGYLIAWGADATSSVNSTLIAWSSLINPLDLTPSAVTGAGNGKPEGAKGEILFCAPNSKGFLVYCKNNVVAAVYTGNKQFPFKFTPVEGSKGSDTRFIDVSGFPNLNSLIAYDTDSYGQFMYSELGGMQIVNSIKAETLLPEVTDFLAGRLVEDFNETTKVFSITEVATDELMLKRIAFIGTRYLIISYGINEYTHALIYDLALEKMGKVKITHVDVFEHRQVKLGTSFRDLAKESIAFMANDGSVSVMSFNPVDTTRTGALILGKYQHHRGRHLILQGVTAENVDAADSFTFTDMVSLDGRNISSLVTGVETVGTVGFREFKLLSSARNHSLAFIGEFILSTIELLYSIGGSR